MFLYYNKKYMKYSVAAIIGTTSAVKLGDAPPFFNEPTWRESFPSAAGLTQVRRSRYELAQAEADGEKEELGKNREFNAKIKYDTNGYDAPDKVLRLDPKWGRTQTTFYAQEDAAPVSPTKKAKPAKKAKKSKSKSPKKASKSKSKSKSPKKASKSKSPKKASKKVSKS